MSPCPEYFSHGNLCAFIQDPAVSEEYIEGLQHIQAIQLFAEYQSKVITELNNMAISPGVSHVSSESASKDAKLINSIQQNLEESITNKISMMKRRFELEALAKTLRSQFPDARMCRNCSYGPISKFGCDDLLAHNHQKSSYGANYDNNCPQCGAAPPKDWKTLPFWNGKLPTDMTKLSGDVTKSIKMTEKSDKQVLSWNDFLHEICSLPEELSLTIDEELTSHGFGYGPDYVFALREEESQSIPSIIVRMVSKVPIIQSLTSCLAQNLTDLAERLNNLKIKSGEILNLIALVKNCVRLSSNNGSDEGSILEYITDKTLSCFCSTEIVEEEVEEEGESRQRQSIFPRNISQMIIEDVLYYKKVLDLQINSTPSLTLDYYFDGFMGTDVNILTDILTREEHGLRVDDGKTYLTFVSVEEDEDEDEENEVYAPISVCDRSSPMLGGEVDFTTRDLKDIIDEERRYDLLPIIFSLVKFI
jgi:hypothetical protein